MKNLILTTIILMATALTFSSCDKDDKDDPVLDNLNGKYEIYINGELYDKGENVLIGLMQDTNQSWTNNVTFGTKIVTAVNQFPETVGSTIDMGTNGDPGLTIAGSDVYYTISGKLKRESKTKVSFEGVCTKMLDPKEYTIKGFVKAEALEKVK